MPEEENKENFGNEYYVSEEQYYERAFARLKETGKHTWNWAAFFFGSGWMAYRKMYLYSLFFSIATKFFIYCIHSLFSFSIYGKFLSLRLLQDDHPYIWLSVEICSCIIVNTFVGYFGNALYYNTIRNKIKKGYHLLYKYSPVSIPSFLWWPFICFADWISRKSQLRTKVESEVNEETVQAYLNPNREDHLANKIANVLACVTFVIYCIIAGAYKG